MQFLATDAWGRIYTLSEDQGWHCQEKLSGNLAVSAKLTVARRRPVRSCIRHPAGVRRWKPLATTCPLHSGCCHYFNVSVTFPTLSPPARPA